MTSNTDERYSGEVYEDGKSQEERQAEERDIAERAAMHEEEKNRGAHYAEERKAIDVDDVRAVMYKMDQEKALEKLVNMSDFKPTNPKDVAATSRIDLSLFPDTAVVYGALGMMEGHLKYGGHNYRIGGVLASVYYSAARRHMMKWFNGEWADYKSGVPHLASALACIAILIDAHCADVLEDDRPPAIADFTTMVDDMQDRVEHLLKVFPPEKSPGRYTEVEHGEQHNHSETLHSSTSSGSPIPPGSDN